ncbi:hypothetical protein [Micromonospora sp. CPCC 206061]|uniref:hypothetical protein n=1 Tax=Micromonospora sp. CPCC 206061 TaxID=3122410 RepID=UPI002FEF459B
MCGITSPLPCIVGREVANSGVEALANAISEGMVALVTETVTWWIDVPSIDLTAQDNVVHTLRGFMLPMAIFVAIAGLMFAGIRMTLSRKGDPLIDIGRGLFSTAFWSAAGIAAPAAALQASDVLSSWILDTSTGGRFEERMVATFSAALASPGLVIVFGILAICAGAVQAVLLIFREIAVLVLSGAVVFAASGQFNSLTRPWLRKILAWGPALIFYKPVAALVYATGFAMIGEGSGVRTLFMGFAILGLSLIALPALLKFFNWSVGSVDGGSGGGFGAGLAAAGGGLHAASWLGGGGGGSSASEHARYVQQTLGPADGGASAAPAGAAPAAGPREPRVGADQAQSSSGATAGRATVGAGPGAAGTGARTGGAAAGAGAGATGAGGGAAAAGAGAGGAAAGAAGAGAAGGPIGVAAVVGAQAAQQGAKNAASKATDAMGG